MSPSLTWPSARGELTRRLAEPAPGRAVLVTGPPASGKTSILMAAVGSFGERAVHLSPGAQPARRRAIDDGWRCAEALAASGTPALLAIDDVHLACGWETRLEGLWRRARARGVPLHVLLAGFALAPAAILGPGLGEPWLDRLTLRPWDAAALIDSGLAGRDAAAARAVAGRAHPMAAELSDAEWTRVVDERLASPALERDLPAVVGVRRPEVLRAVLEACVSVATRIVTLGELTMAAGGRTSIETVSRHLQLLEAAGLVAALRRHGEARAGLARAAHRIVLLDNALFWTSADSSGSRRFALADPRNPRATGERPLSSWRPASAGRIDAPAPFDVMVRNACLAHAWHAGQRVTWWREDAREVDALVDGEWGRWIVRVEPGPVAAGDFEALVACCERHPEYEPVLVGDDAGRAAAREADIEWVDWREWMGRTP